MKWITASRPALIVMAPQMVHTDPAQALAKVRSVPRGRVPIFFVGDAADEPRMSGLADGFFIRPLSADALIEQARAVLTAAAKGSANGGRRRPRTSEGIGPNSGAVQEFAQGGHTPKSGPHLARPAGGLKPLKASPASSAAKVSIGQRPARDANALLSQLTAGIDELFDADLSDALAAAPRIVVAPEGEREFDDIPTDDRRQRPSTVDRRAALLARYALVEEGDYFQVLGLPRDASADDARRAADRIALELAPAAIDPALAGELGDKLAAVREVVGEAGRVLGDEQLRSRYQSHLS